MSYKADSIPAGWSQRRIDSVADVNAQTLSARSLPPIFDYLDLESVFENRCVTRRISAADAPSRARRRVRDGDLLIGTVRPLQRHVARIDQAPDTLVASTGFAVVSPGPDIDGRFLYYSLVSDPFYEYLCRVADGGAYPAFNPAEISEAELAFPSLESQRAIAGVLGALDDKIELNRRMNETLARLTVEHFRHAYWRSPDRKTWNEERLGAHLEVVRGLSYTGAGLTADGLPLHNLNSVHEGGGYKREGLKRYSGEFKERHVVRAGDVIVANTDLTWNFEVIASPAMIPGHHGDTGLFSHHLYRVRPKEGSPLTHALVYLLLLAGPLRTEVAGYANGTTVNMLPQDALQKPVFRVPPPDLARKLDDLVTPLFARAEAGETESETLAELRDALLPKLISGELRVRDAEAELGSLP